MVRENRIQQDDIVQIWDDVASGYNLDEYWANKVHQAWFRTLLATIGDPNGRSLLEVGCGSAFQSLSLAERGGNVSLLDLSPKSIEYARAAFAARGQPLPTCHVCDALDSEIPDNSVDVAWNMGVIEHFTDEGKMRLIREMVRMTKPAGKTIIMVPNRLCWPFQIGQVYRKLRGTWQYGKEDDMSPGRLRRLCRKLSILDYESYAFDPISGWYWLPFIGGRMRRIFAPKPVDAYLQKSLFGWMSVLIIPKPTRI